MNKTSSMHVGPNGEPHSQQPSEEEVKEEVVRLACAEGLVTMYTSAVGVHVLDNPVNPNDTVKHEIPVQVLYLLLGIVMSPNMLHELKSAVINIQKCQEVLICQQNKEELLLESIIQLWAFFNETWTCKHADGPHESYFRKRTILKNQNW